ncbi:MAG: hypothetical protein HW394_1388 [Acidobacteria bacterium]|nr:hypothetical protein [Acidobacteriota bacterium]
MTPEGAAKAAFTIVTAEKCIPAAVISERDRISTG